MNKGNQKGITLIALIITIIVMLILLGVSVKTITESNLFNHASNAVERYSSSQEEELTVAKNLVNKLDEIESDSSKPEQENKEWTFVESFSSPNYPENYPNNVNEVITKDYGANVTAIKIVVKDIQLEGGCSFDYLRFYKGSSVDSSLLMRLCDGMGTLIIKSNVFTFNFVTDGSVTRRGYTFDVFITTDENCLGCEEGWTAAQEEENESGTEEPSEPDPIPSNPEDENVEWTFVESFSSPNYPENYPNDTNEVTTKEYGTDVTAIKIVVKDIQLEGGCSFDYLLFYKGSTVESSLAKRACDGEVGTLIIKNNVFTFNFVTDGSVTRRGYTFDVFTTTAQGCEEGWTAQETETETEGDTETTT